MELRKNICQEYLKDFTGLILARARKAGGSGLGLSIAKHIIEAHGETIHVRSKTDVGTTLGFTLPSAKTN